MRERERVKRLEEGEVNKNTERERDGERQTDIETETERNTEIKIQRERQTERETERDRQTDRQRQREGRWMLPANTALSYSNLLSNPATSSSPRSVSEDTAVT